MRNLKSIVITLLFWPAIVFSADVVYRVPIHGTIDLGLPAYIERVIEQAAIDKPALIVFDIDTFGGRIDGATRIKDAIMASPVPTIAFINRRAISAGALISLSCEKIYMTDGGTIGAATAVDAQGKKASEKVISYMRGEMSATAEARGRSTSIAEAMVDEELEVLFIIVNGDTLNLDDVAGSKSGKLITLTTQKAIRLGIADGSAETFDELLQEFGLGAAKVINFKPNWSERLVRFLTDPVVSSLLMSIGVLGLIFEVKSPGFGVGGIIGVIALVLFFSTSFIAQLANFTELIIVLAGASLLILEVVVIPGFGLAGVSGIGLMLYGMFQMLLGEYPSPELIERAFVGLNIGILAGLIGMFVLLRALVTSKFFKKHVPMTSEDYSVSKGLEELIGTTVVALTECMPTGKAQAGDHQINIVSGGEFIEKGAKIEILSVEGNTARVRIKSED